MAKKRTTKRATKQQPVRKSKKKSRSSDPVEPQDPILGENLLEDLFCAYRKAKADLFFEQDSAGFNRILRVRRRLGCESSQACETAQSSQACIITTSTKPPKQKKTGARIALKLGGKHGSLFGKPLKTAGLAQQLPLPIGFAGKATC